MNDPKSLQEDELRAIVELVVEKLPLDRLADLVADRIVSVSSMPSIDNPTESPGAIMEPFFFPHKRKWRFFFSDWGCIRCGQGENEGLAHVSNGLCVSCHSLVTRWLVDSVKKRAEDSAVMTAEDAITKHRHRPLTSEELALFTPDTIMEPWFLPKEIETAIGQLVPISKRRKWRYFFLDHGCLRCKRTYRKNYCLGLCKKCYLWINYHLGTSITRHLGGSTPENLTAKLTLRASTVQRVLAGEEVLPLPQEPEPSMQGDPFYMWKKKLGRGCARIIDALTNRGELTTDEIAKIAVLEPRTVLDNLAVLRRNTLIESHDGRHVLRTPCEECRQHRLTLFHGARRRPKSPKEQS